MAGEKLKDFNLKKRKLGHVGVKESGFSVRPPSPASTPLLGPEIAHRPAMVMGIVPLLRSGRFARASSAGGTSVLPPRAPCSSPSAIPTRPDIVEAVLLLFSLGFKVMAKSGTQRFSPIAGCRPEKVNKVLEGRPHIVEAIMNGDIQLVFNTTEGPQAMADSRSLRRAAPLA